MQTGYSVKFGSGLMRSLNKGADIPPELMQEEKGKKARIGETHEWGGKKYQKVGEGEWKPVGEGGAQAPEMAPQEGELQHAERPQFDPKTGEPKSSRFQQSAKELSAFHQSYDKAVPKGNSPGYVNYVPKGGKDGKGHEGKGESWLKANKEIGGFEARANVHVQRAEAVKGTPEAGQFHLAVAAAYRDMAHHTAKERDKAQFGGPAGAGLKSLEDGRMLVKQEEAEAAGLSEDQRLDMVRQELEEATKPVPFEGGVEADVDPEKIKEMQKIIVGSAVGAGLISQEQGAQFLQNLPEVQ